MVDAFGAHVLRPTVARPADAGRGRVRHPEERRRLDGIVHPLVRARAAELAAAAAPDAVVVNDVPLLVETVGGAYDLVIVVEADPRIGWPGSCTAG